MAIRRLQMRKKLMLGMAIVAINIMLLVPQGAAYGFYAYYTSVKITDKKLLELDPANRLIGAINSLEQVDPNDTANYLREVQTARALLDEYRWTNNRTVSSGHDPDGGEEERELMARLEKQFKELGDNVQELKRPELGSETTDQTKRKRLCSICSCSSTRLTAEIHLRLAIMNDIQVNSCRSAATIQQSVWWVAFFFIWAVALILTMLYYFRTWIFATDSRTPSRCATRPRREFRPAKRAQIRRRTARTRGRIRRTHCPFARGVRRSRPGR